MNNYKIFNTSLFLLLFVSFSFAQLRVEKANGEFFQDGETFTFNETGTIGGEEGKLKFFMFNESEDQNITAKIEVKELRGTDGSDFIFCVQPLCIFSVEEGMSYPANGAVINPESYNSQDDYFINSDSGDENTTTIEYDLRFYAVDDEGNEFDELTITYVYDATFSNLEFDLPKLGINVHNTQVKSNLNLDSNDQFKMQVFSLSGKKVLSSQVQKGFNQISLNQLSQGLYIAKFSNHKGSSQIKIIKE